MSKFAILLGGPVTPTKRLSRQLAGARIIAADGGMAHAAALGLTPELWVGDFDSASPALLAAWAQVPQVPYPVEKAASDGALAVDEARRRGATTLLLVGGLGGQLDHQLAHIGILFKYASENIDIMLTSGEEEARALTHKMVLDDVPRGSRLSIMPLTDLRGLSISGVKWPLAKRDVALGDSLTLANVVEGVVHIDVQGGQAVVVAHPR